MINYAKLCRVMLNKVIDNTHGMIYDNEYRKEYYKKQAIIH